MPKSGDNTQMHGWKLAILAVKQVAHGFSGGSVQFLSPALLAASHCFGGDSAPPVALQEGAVIRKTRLAGFQLKFLRADAAHFYRNAISLPS